MCRAPSARPHARPPEGPGEPCISARPASTQIFDLDTSCESAIVGAPTHMSIEARIQFPHWCFMSFLLGHGGQRAHGTPVSTGTEPALACPVGLHAQPEIGCPLYYTVWYGYMARKI